MGRRLKASDPTKATSPKPAEVEVRNIAHPRIWKTALMIAKGKKELIEVESYSKLTIVEP
jgi:hypothetical protein